MLRYNKKLYVSKNVTVRKELLKQYYNDVLTKYFDAKKIRKLLNRKYHTKYIIKNVKSYVNIYNVC